MHTAKNERQTEEARGAEVGPRRRLLRPVAALVAGLVLATAAWFLLRPKPPPPPAIDPTGLDREVVEVIERAREEVLDSPRSGKTWGRLGMVLLAHEFGAESFVALVEAERLDPREPRWPYLQSVTLEQGDPEGAIAKLRRATELSPGRATRLRLAELMLTQGHLDEADGLFRQVGQADAGNARAELGRARVARARGDWTACLKHLRRAVAGPEAQPKAAHDLLAEVCHQLPGREADAEQEREIASRLPDDVVPEHPYWREVMDLRVGARANIQRGGQLRKQGRLVEALTLMDDTARRYPDRYEVWLEVGAAHFANRDIPGAEHAYREAIRCDPNHAESHFRLGAILYFQRGQRPQALAESADAFRRATRLGPTMYLAHLRLAVCHQDKKEWAGAVTAYRTALECRPDCAYAHVQLAALFLEAADPASAGPAALQLVGCPAALDVAGFFRAQALIHVRAATELAPNDPDTRLALHKVRAAFALDRAP